DCAHMSGIADPNVQPRFSDERNPTFGQGALRRRVKLIADTGLVRAGVEDSYHSFRLTLRHDGARITAIEPVFLRVPLTTCPSAERPLQGFVGMPLDMPWRQLVAQENPRVHCTHLHDLCQLAMAQARRSGSRSYEVTVPDEYPDPVWTTLYRDGKLLLRWKTFRGAVLEPEAYAERPLLKGFSSWANAEFSGDDLEAALVLHKAYFVSRARSWNVEASAGKGVAHHEMMRGACHSYNEPQMSVAIRHRDNNVDTSDPALPLLADLD
ncbi:MAG: DUF2889 domain-containing protein, partial [Gammaproteobacteria bacterium]|nr:DUF2889 domain-containing protein [Gammaproteobacteria bacterium]